MATWSRFVTDQAAPAVALLAANAEKRALLQRVLGEFGYQVTFAGEPSGLDCEALANISADLWLLELPDESALSDWLLEHSDVPVLLGAGEVPELDSEDYPRWERRLYGKLIPLLGEVAGGRIPRLAGGQDAPATAGEQPHQAPSVWLLAASLGGPDAVKAFLDRLPADLPVAFVYAQHIDAGFETRLPTIIGRHNAWRVINCVQGAPLQAGEVLIAPIKRRLGFSPQGCVELHEDGWPGPYQPSIETMLDEVARAFAPACGAIIFSGMGEDGVGACGRLRNQGIPVWTQDAGSATCEVMPMAVADAGYSSLQGSPQLLADALRDWLAQEWPLAL